MDKVLGPLFLLLPIMLPVAGGALIIFLGFKDDRKRNIYSECVVILTSILVWISLFAVRREPVTLYSFAQGFAIELWIDGCAALFSGMVSVMWPLVMLYAFKYMENEERKNQFFAFYVMTYGVTLGVAFSENMTTLYVFYEMLSLVTIPLVIHYQDHDSLFAGRKYAAYTIGGAALAFFAVLLTTVFGQSGDFIYGGSMQAGGLSSAMLQLTFIFGFFGFGVKAAVFPLYDWLPTASVAPTPVTALLHAVAVVNSGVFAIARMSWYVFDPGDLSGSTAQHLTAAVSAFTLVFAAVMAVKERHFKKRLAWSTVSNLSYMLFGIVLLAAFAYGGPAAVNPATSTDFFGPKYAGTNYGIIMLALGLSSVVFNMVSNAMVNISGGYTLTFIAGAASAGVSVIIYLVINMLTRKPAY